MTPAEEKAALRRQFPSLTEDGAADAALAEHALRHPAVQKAKTVFCFVGTPGEIDTRPLLKALLAGGKQVFVPVSLPRGQMLLRRLHDLADLRGADRYGIPIPPEGREEAAAADIDVTFVPGVCFTPDGGRLGRGGGYYDRFLQQFTGTALGLCRTDRVTGHIPMGQHDRRVGAVITQAGVLPKTREGEDHGGRKKV